MTTTETQPEKNLFGLLTPQQLAEQLGVTVRTLQLWQVKRTGPPVVQAGRQVYYRVTSVEARLALRERRPR
jgi:DNA-binding transcriptional MerR regulator